MTKPNLLGNSLCVPNRQDIWFIHVELTKMSYIGTLFKIQFIQDSVYTGFQFIQGSVYSGFSLYRISVYSGYSLYRISVYSGFSLYRISVYPGFGLDSFHCINIQYFFLVISEII